MRLSREYLCRICRIYTCQAQYSSSESVEFYTNWDPIFFAYSAFFFAYFPYFGYWFAYCTMNQIKIRFKQVQCMDARQFEQDDVTVPVMVLHFGLPVLL
jgi:hypothetical protein